MPPRVLLTALALMPALAVTGCGGQQRAVATDTVVMDEYEFVPESLTIESGATLTVRNEGDVAHNLVVEGPRDPFGEPRKLIGTDTFLGNSERKLKMSLPPGRYTMICSVPGHRRLGMQGALTVR